MTPIPPPPALDATEFPPWGVRDVALGLVLYVMLAIAALVVARLAAQWGLLSVGTSSREATLVVAALAELAMLLPVWLIAVVARRGTWRSLGFRGFNFGTGCLLVPAAFLGALMVNALWGLFLRQMGWDTQADIAGLFGTSPFAIAFGFLTVAVIAPVAEETLFRGFVLGGLRRSIGTVGALLVSSALFTLPHLPPTIYPAIFGLGLFFGLLFLWTKSLFPSMIVHGLINGLAFAVQVYCSVNGCQVP